MKNFVKWFGIIAFMVVIGFSMAACDTGGGNTSGGGNSSGGSGGDGGSGSGALGNTLSITNQQVYYEDRFETVFYTPYTGSKTLDSSSLYGGTGAITNGKFSFTLGTPANTHLKTYDEYNFLEDIGFANVTVSNPQAKGLGIAEFETTDGVYLFRGISTEENNDSTSHSQTFDSVMYIYVDNDVTLSGKGKTEIDQGINKYGDAYKDTTTTKDFSLKLKIGWNAVRINGAGTFTESLENDDIISNFTMSISLGDPSSCKWVLDENDYIPPPSLGRSLTNVPETKKTTLWFKRFNRKFGR